MSKCSFCGGDNAEEGVALGFMASEQRAAHEEGWVILRAPGIDFHHEGLVCYEPPGLPVNVVSGLPKGRRYRLVRTDRFEKFGTGREARVVEVRNLKASDA